MSPRPLPRTLLCLLALACACAVPALARYGGNEWKPVDPAELTLKAPSVEKDADAEVLFWEVRVVYEDSGGSPATVLNHYVRVKVFNERGRETQSKVDIYAPKFGGREFRIKDVAARTIKPDGTVVELKAADVFEREVLRTSGLKVKAKSFAMPAVEPGAIIEYRWRELRNGISGYERFDFSRDIPVRLVKYSVKPYDDSLVDGSGRRVSLRAQTFHGRMTPFVREKDGSYTTTMSDVPAFREEPRMPPEYAVRPWMLVYYSSDDGKITPRDYWQSYGRRIAAAFKPQLKANDDVRKAAAEAAGDAQEPEQKLERLFNFVRAKVKRYNDDASGFTPEQIKKLKDNKSPADTLKRGVGSSGDIDMLFGAMASTLGFEVRVACTSDREDIFFDPNFPDDYFVDPASVAVKVGDQWRLFNPGMTYATFGMLRWQEEGQQTLVADEREPVWIKSPSSDPAKSVERRTGKFTLSEDGTLEGEVRIEYTGHLAADHKEYNDDDTPAEREETLRERFKGRLSGVEIADVKVENATDPDKPFVHAFRVRVPGYAQRTGKRLFLQPAFFERGVAPLFSTEARRHMVYFHYPWSEEDTVEITLPEGYGLDSPDAPAPFGAGEISRYDAKLSVSTDGRRLVYRRSFFFGGGGRGLLFPAASYPGLKTVFDELNKRDNHTITLKQGAATATNAAAPGKSN